MIEKTLKGGRAELQLIMDLGFWLRGLLSETSCASSASL